MADSFFRRFSRQPVTPVLVFEANFQQREVIPKQKRQPNIRLPGSLRAWKSRISFLMWLLILSPHYSPWPPHQRPCPLVTIYLDGQLLTDKLKDVTGKSQSLLALKCAVVFIGRSFRMQPGTARRYIVVVEYPTSIDEIFRRRLREFGQEASYNVACLPLSAGNMERLDGLLGRLVRSEAGPGVTAAVL